MYISLIYRASGRYAVLPYCFTACLEAKLYRSSIPQTPHALPSNRSQALLLFLRSSLSAISILRTTIKHALSHTHPPPATQQSISSFHSMCCSCAVLPLRATQYQAPKKLIQRSCFPSRWLVDERSSAGIDSSAASAKADGDSLEPLTVGIIPVLRRGVKW